ncbi:hypothetical protein F5B20DRAFT_24104 [Whalleya microplaca]|nr:hypothetical protein F5B20DRAFT_24104 [Whalleya microplaca]
MFPFLSLPPEIRREIYILATPPRIVDIQEEAEEDGDEFEDRFSRDWPQLRLSPSLTYFAHNWRSRLYEVYRPPNQMRLDAYGFTSNKPPYRPWTPSSATPEIPIFGLVKNMSLAWELLRDSYLYSNAPIPPLLHTCIESRSVLIGHGYQLAFQTRTNGPRTWFHFGKDILYLEYGRQWPPDEPGFLCSAASYMGQFEPSDMRKVKRVALARATFPYTYQGTIEHVTAVLRLMPAIEEWIAVEWNPYDFIDTEASFRISHATPAPGDIHLAQDQAKARKIREPWQAVPAEDIDVLFCPKFTESQFENYLTADGIREDAVRSFVEDNGGSADGFYEHYSRLAEERLKESKEQILGRDQSAISWNIPKVTVWHVCRPVMARAITRERRRAWETWLRLKEERMIVERRKKPVINTPVNLNTDVVRELSPFSAQWGDDMEVLIEMERSEMEPPPERHRCMLCDEDAQWLIKATFPAPGRR